MHTFRLVFNVPERALGAAVGVLGTTHSIEDFEHELAVWYWPSKFNAAYAVSSDGVSVHACQG